MCRDILIFSHIVTYNSEETIIPCLDSLLGQQYLQPPYKIQVLVTDNHSSDGTAECIKSHFDNLISLQQNSINLGFTGAQNEGITRGINSGADYILLLNPDARLAPDAVYQLLRALEEDTRAGAACPKLLRADKKLNPIMPPVIDSTGMYITPEIRHFDRGSQEKDVGQYQKDEYVFGASGAAVMFKRIFILDVLLHSAPPGEVLPFFDNAFFAYREDADLAWRAQYLGWKCRYVPQAEGYHERRVLPEKRSLLPDE